MTGATTCTLSSARNLGTYGVRMELMHSSRVTRQQPRVNQFLGLLALIGTIRVCTAADPTCLSSATPVRLFPFFAASVTVDVHLLETQVELTYGSRVLGPSSVGAPEYIGNGAYRVSYVATKVSVVEIPSVSYGTH